MGMCRRFAGITERQLLVSPSTSSAHHLVRGDNNSPNRLRGPATCRFKEYIGCAPAQVVEKYLVEFVIVILAGVDENMIACAVERRDHTRQANDLGPGADHGHHLQPFDSHTFIQIVSGRARSKISFAQSMHTKSPSPMFVML